jgi:hypothetical protein
MADKKKKQLKSYMVAFRITENDAELIARILESQPITGVDSVSQYFRKLGRDFLAGRLVYKNPNDMLGDTDLVSSG